MLLMATRGPTQEADLCEPKKTERDYKPLKLHGSAQRGQTVLFVRNLRTRCPRNQGVGRGKLACSAGEAEENPRPFGPLTSFSAARYKIYGFLT
jgi:hypothetical protein